MTQHHCDHECVCCDYGIVTREEDEVCTITNCINDTRNKTPAPAAPRPPCEECIYLARSEEEKTAIRNQTLDELIVELNRQSIGKTKEGIKDMLFECQSNPEKWLESIRTREHQQ